MDIEDNGCFEEELTESCNISKQQFKSSKVFKGKSRTKGLEGTQGTQEIYEGQNTKVMLDCAELV